MSKETGKPITAARESIAETFSDFEDYMEQAEVVLTPRKVFEDNSKKHMQILEPRGVIAAIAPWNVPFNNLSAQMGQALIAGNAVVFKPSEETVLFTQLIAELIAKSDLPDEVFAPIIGGGKVGELLLRQDIDMVLFTGSTQTGQQITKTASERMLPTLTEMGGSAPGIVFEDADLTRVIDSLAAGRFDNAGQYCDGLK